jgi:hypothetical protein
MALQRCFDGCIGDRTPRPVAGIGMKADQQLALRIGFGVHSLTSWILLNALHLSAVHTNRCTCHPLSGR